MESFKPLIRCRGRGRTGLKCARLSRTGFRGLGIPPPIRFDVAESTPLLAQAMTVDQHGLGQHLFDGNIGVSHNLVGRSLGIPCSLRKQTDTQSPN